MSKGKVLGHAARWAMSATAATALIASNPYRRVLPAGDPAVAYRYATPGAVAARLSNLGRVRRAPGLAPSPQTGQAHITSSPDHQGEGDM